MTHPGIILRAQFFAPLGISQRRAAQATGIPERRLSALLAGHRPLTADIAARLGRYFGVSPRNWLNLQVAFDLWLIEGEYRRELTRIRPFKKTKRHGRKRVLVPEYEALMASTSSNDVQNALNEIRG